jgi:hypothetical protein
VEVMFCAFTPQDSEFMTRSLCPWCSLDGMFSSWVPWWRREPRRLSYLGTFIIIIISIIIIIQPDFVEEAKA